MRASNVTTDHQQIRRWVEERKGAPARVIRTEGDADDDAGLLRIDFPGYSGEGTLEHISWEAFFETFEHRQLALLYQDETADGHRSYFSKLVSRRAA